MTLTEAIDLSGRVYLIGNGGSYANANHLCNDLLACGVRAYTCDSATLSAFANDYGWEVAFSRWLAVVGESGDLLVALSGSGKSPNILNAICEAERRGMLVHRIFGNERGENMQEAEEMQLTIGHMARLCLRQKTS
jgi:D-sedoheptulose 7-phosphate isomerase